MAITINSKGYGGEVSKPVNYGSSTPVIFIMAITVFVTAMILWLALFAVNFSLKNQKSGLETRRADLQLKKSNLKQDEIRLLDIQRRTAQIKDILSSHPNASLIFDALNLSTRGDVSFISADVDLAGGRVEMSGRAKDFTSLAAQMLAFQRDDQNRFRSVKVANIRRDISDAGEGFIVFNIKMDFDKAILIPED